MARPVNFSATATRSGLLRSTVSINSSQGRSSHPIWRRISHLISHMITSIEKRADRLLIMNAANGFGYKVRHRQHLDSLQLGLRLGAQRNSVGRDQFLDRRLVEPVARRIGQNRMGG